MGGLGSGRKYGKDCADDMRRLDVRQLARDGCLQTGMTIRQQWTLGGDVVASLEAAVESEQIWLIYRQRQHDGEWLDMCYPVCMDRTACHLGGERVWWRCPAVGCGRRVAVLYGGNVFACRHCHQLAYRCQREADDQRAIRRANTLRDRLEWKPGILHGEGWKPKGMHWRTFARLRAEYETHINRALVGMTTRLDLLDRRLHGLLPVAGDGSQCGSTATGAHIPIHTAGAV